MPALDVGKWVDVVMLKSVVVAGFGKGDNEVEVRWSAHSIRGASKDGNTEHTHLHRGTALPPSSAVYLRAMRAF